MCYRNIVRCCPDWPLFSYTKSTVPLLLKTSCFLNIHCYWLSTESCVRSILSEPQCFTNILYLALHTLTHSEKNIDIINVLVETLQDADFKISSYFYLFEIIRFNIRYLTRL